MEEGPDDGIGPEQENEGRVNEASLAVVFCFFFLLLILLLIIEILSKGILDEQEEKDQPTQCEARINAQNRSLASRTTGIELGAADRRLENHEGLLRTGGGRRSERYLGPEAFCCATVRVYRSASERT